MKEGKKECDALLIRIAAGDRSALEKLYERLKSPVYGLALAMLKNRPDAEDVMQNVFLRVWDVAPQYRPGTDAGAWVMKITRNLSTDRLQVRKNTTDIMELSDVLSDGGEVASSPERMLLRELLEKLSDAERQIVVLYAVGGYSHKEIAGIVGRPYATVRWKYRNAMKKLQRMLEKEDFYEQKTQYAGIR